MLISPPSCYRLWELCDWGSGDLSGVVGVGAGSGSFALFYSVDREVIPKGMWFGRVVVISRVMIGSRVFVGSCWVSLGVGALGGYEQVLADDVTETGLGTPSLLCRDPPAQLTSDRNITRTSFQGLFHPATTHKSISYPRQGLSELIGPNIPNSKQTTFDDPRSAFPFHLPCLGARLFFSLTLACCRRLGLSPGFLSAKFHDAIDGVSSHQASAPTCPFSARGVALSRVGPEPGDTLLISSSSLPHTHSAPPPPVRGRAAYVARLRRVVTVCSIWAHTERTLHCAVPGTARFVLVLLYPCLRYQVRFCTCQDVGLTPSILALRALVPFGRRISTPSRRSCRTSLEP